MQTKEQRAKRAKLVADARAISDAVKDGETMSAEDSAKFDAIMAEADKLKADIDRIERLDDAEIELKNKIGHRAGRENISEDEAKAKAAVEAAAFKHYMRFGVNGMDDDIKSVALPRIKAAQGTGIDSAGGYLVPTGFYSDLIQAQLAFAGLVGGECRLNIRTFLQGHGSQAGLVLRAGGRLGWRGEQLDSFQRDSGDTNQCCEVLAGFHGGPSGVSHFCTETQSIHPRGIDLQRGGGAGLQPLFQNPAHTIRALQRFRKQRDLRFCGDGVEQRGVN